MGANATHSSNAISAEKNRKHLTVRTSSENINVLVQKDKNRHSKLPEESHTANRIYVSVFADGKDVKEISRYGADGKKLYAIHTANHKGLSPHYHKWDNGIQLQGAYPLTPEMSDLLEYVRKYGCYWYELTVFVPQRSDYGRWFILFCGML